MRPPLRRGAPPGPPRRGARAHSSRAANTRRAGGAPGAAAKESADEFVARVNRELSVLAEEGQAAGFTLDTYITTDTPLLNSRANHRNLAYLTKGALIKWPRNAAPPAPDDAVKRARLTQLEAQLEASYGEGKYCPKGPASCITLDQLPGIPPRA